MTRDDQAQLRSVTLPIVARDIDENLPRIFRLWSDPRFDPLGDGAAPQDGAARNGAAQRAPVQHLVIVVNRATPELQGRILAITRQFPMIARCFAGVDVVDAGLEGDRDLYLRGSNTAGGAFGNKAGPNFLFAAAMKAAGVYGGFTFQMELDCLPVAAGWLPALERIAAQNARAWVIGSIYAGAQGLGKTIQDHLNGNALYKAGDAAFQHFLDSEWMPGLMAHVAAGHANLAYDCWWAIERGQADPHAGNAAWERVRRYDGFFRNDPFLLNFLGRAGALHAARRWMEEMATLNRRPLFLHGPTIRALPTLLLAWPDLGMADALDLMSELTPEPGTLPQQAQGTGDAAAGGDLAGMTGNMLVVSLCSRLLLDPTGALAAIRCDRALALRLGSALADPALSLALMAHWQRLHARAVAVSGVTSDTMMPAGATAGGPTGQKMPIDA